MSRRAQPLTPAQKSIVASVRRISKQRARINDAYIDAVIAAREAGVTYSAIAAAAGTSSQAAQEIVRRHRVEPAKGHAESGQAPAADLHDAGAPMQAAPAGEAAAVEAHTGAAQDAEAPAAGAGGAGAGGSQSRAGSSSAAMHSQNDMGLAAIFPESTRLSPGQ